MLVSAYRQGIFPWFNEEPILWWSPDPRFVLVPSEVHVSHSMARVLRGAEFDLTLDLDFAGVIHDCATTPRPGQDGTWITRSMEEAYVGLHRLGIAHSCEAWLDGELVGGLYGVALGAVFFGESMFSHAANASKAALITLGRFLARNGFRLIDAQMHTPHLQSMGGHAIPRAEFLGVVRRAVEEPGLEGGWGNLLTAADRGLRSGQ